MRKKFSKKYQIIPGIFLPNKSIKPFFFFLLEPTFYSGFQAFTDKRNLSKQGGAGEIAVLFKISELSQI